MIPELEKYKKDCSNNKTFTEVMINTACGKSIAGKWWGDLNRKPILCLHGWQDNAGTFDRLIQQLPKQFSYLAIDFLGHGKSSWLPRGVPYNVFDNMYTILLVMNEYGWEKVSIIGHSMGGAIAFLFAIHFPDKIEMLITIEFGKNPDRSDEERLLDSRENVLNFMKLDEKFETFVEPPCYTIEEMIEKVQVASFGNVTADSAPFIIERNIKRSEKNPNKFFFSRDPRLRNMILTTYPENLTLHGSRHMKIPYLFIYSPASPLFAKEFFFDKMIEALRKNQRFRVEIINSDSHHYHLNQPETVSTFISDFLMNNSDQKIKSHL